MNLYWNDTHTAYAALISPGFGAGWSSWEGTELAYDKRVVEFWLAHKDDEKWMKAIKNFESSAHDEAANFFRSIGYENCPYMSGFANIELVWIPSGALWRVDEYDGAETIVFWDDENWICFEQEQG